MYVRTTGELEKLCSRVDGRIGLDTEFVSERTFYPRLGVVQLSAGEECAVVDPRSVDLAPLLDLLGDPAVEVVVHAGEQDLQILARRSGSAPRTVVDVQVAAGLAGFGGGLSYSRLVDRVLGVRLRKRETLTDWTRDLTAEQIRYAEDDVRYLLPLWDRIRERLESRGRMEWLREEMRRLESEEAYREGDPRTAYVNVKGQGGLHGKQLAVLRELAAWREETARADDFPRGHIVRDPALVSIAARAPRSMGDLHSVRLLRHDMMRRYGEQILKVVRRAVELPESEWPDGPPRAPEPLEDEGIVDLLQAVLRARAHELRVSPGIVARRADLEALVRGHPTPLAAGWRNSLFADELRRVVAGELRVGVDGKGRVRVFPL